MQEALTAEQIREIYGFAVGDKIFHTRDDSCEGFVTEIDADHDQGGVTTCRVAWDVKSYDEAKLVPREDQDIQWTTKLELAD